MSKTPIVECWACFRRVGTVAIAPEDFRFKRHFDGSRECLGYRTSLRVSRWKKRLTMASTVTAAPVDLAANNVDAGAAAGEP